MTRSTTATLAGAPGKARSKPTKRFRATAGAFGDAADRSVMDRLTRWVESYFAADLLKRPSKHVYVRKLPGETIAMIDQLRDSPVIHDAILKQFPPGSAMTPMKHTDELYISHYNHDFGGDQGLFDKHYDGNLRFVPVGSVVRALIYVQSDSNYTVVFGDSQLSKAFTTYEFGLLDFHRELHWVEGEYKPGERRILLKCNYLICPANAHWLEKTLLGANTAVFYVVKAAMEYSKSPKTLPQRAVGLVCNVARLLNNIHPLVPIACLALLFAAVGWGVFRLLV